MRSLLVTFALAAAIAVPVLSSLGASSERVPLGSPGVRAMPVPGAPPSHRAADAPEAASAGVLAGAGLLVVLLLAVRRGD